MKFFRIFSVSFLFALLFFASFSVTHAENTEQIFRLKKETLVKGFTVSDKNGNFKLAITPNMFSDPVTVFLKTLSADTYPSQFSDKKIVSEVYEYSISSSQTGKLPRPVIVSVGSGDTSLSAKELFYYDKFQKKWFPFSNIQKKENGMRLEGRTVLPSIPVAIFASSSVMEGKASWYRDSVEKHVAATNAFPLGSKLRIINISNKKQIEVKVVSTWQGRKNFLIDITSDAFKKLAALGEGIIRVRIEKI